MRLPFTGSCVLTQGFGGNKPDYVRFGLQGHNGLDYGLPTGALVVAPHSGKIIEAASDPTGYGNYLKIENDKGGSVLAHLQDFLVKVGDVVTEGQVIAHSDNTGNSTGPHLHWGYYTFPRNRQNGYNGFIDQSGLIQGGGSNVANYYKGYDLTNQDSMKVAVDVLVRVQGGELVDKSKADPKYQQAIQQMKDILSKV